MTQTGPAPAELPAPASWHPVFEQLAFGVILAGEDGRFLRGNARAREILRLSPTELASLSLDDPRWCPRTPEGEWLEPERRPGVICLRTGRQVGPVRVAYTWSDGDPIWLDLTASPTGSGEVLLTFLDASEAQLTQALLEIRARLQDLSSHASLPDLLRAALDEAEALTGSTIGFFHFVDPDQEHIHLQAWSTRTSAEFCQVEAVGMHYPVSQAGVWVDALKARAPVIHNDYAALPNRKGLPPGHALVLRELVVPVLEGDRVVALLGVGNKPLPYGPREVDLVQRMAGLTWDIVERKRDEAALRASAARHQGILEACPDALWLVNADGRLAEVNASASAMLGWTREELLERSIAEVEVQEDPLQVEAHMARLLHQGWDRFESRHRRRDGSTFPVEVSSAVLPGTGQVVAFIRDISARKDAEAALKAARDAADRYFDTAGVLLVALDRQGRVTRLNRVGYELLGYSPGELDGADWFSACLEPEEAIQIKTLFSRIVAGELAPISRYENLVRCKDGTRRLMAWTNTFIQAADGSILETLSSGEDITQQRAAEQALRESEARYRVLFDTVPTGITLADMQGRVIETNPAATTILGLTADQHKQRTIDGTEWGIVRPDGTPMPAEEFPSVRALKEGRPILGVEMGVLRARDDMAWISVNAAPVPGTGVVVSFAEHTDRKLAEQRLQASEARLRQAMEVARLGIWDWDPVSDRTAWFGAMFDLYGITPEAFTGRGSDYLAFTREDYREIQARNLQEAFACGTTEEAFLRGQMPDLGQKELCIVRPDGSECWTLGSAVVLVDEAGRVKRMLGVSLDITERKRKELALEALERVDRIIQRHGLQASAAMQSALMEALLDILGADRAWLFHSIDPELRIGILAAEATRSAYPSPVPLGIPFPVQAPFKEMIQIGLDTQAPVAWGPGLEHPLPEGLTAFQVQSVMGVTLRPQQGQPWLLGVHACRQAKAWTASERTLLSQIASRITDAINSQTLFDELKASEDRYASLARNVPGVIYRYSLREGGIYYSPRATEVLGWTPEELLAHPQRWHEAIHPEDLPRVDAAISAAVSRGMELDVTYRIRIASGEERLLHDRASLRSLPDGDRVLDGLAVDITEAHRAAQAKEDLERQVARAQKMESLGSLAGGVAHDMNNVLGAILALSSIYEQKTPGDSPLRHAMETISKACLRGRSMVQSLLSFARRDLAEILILDLNEVVREEAALLSRTTLQKVEVVLDLEPSLARVEGDPAALGHALMNLCVNAVDAMPEGGRLTLRTRNLPQGWVGLSVEDTGTGMPPEVLARATDPFFTTKPQGKGTGLGLAIVYGTAKSHRGRLDLKSEAGRGSCITLELPACTRSPEVPPAPEPLTAPAGSLAGLRVLVVDDDDLVRGSLTPLLEELGCSCVTMDGGVPALEALARGLEVDAVILDLNMPGMDGAATLPRIRELRPAVPILLSTGRADETARDLAARYPAVDLLPKPFTPEELSLRLGRIFAR